MNDIKIEQVSPDVLSPASYNPRKLSEPARAALRRGVEAFGLVDPIIARRSDNLVIGGHQRLTVAKEMGLATVPVVYLDDIDDQRAAALNVLLNNPSAQGEWDFGLLSGLLSDLDAHGFDATLTGFDDEELESLLSWAPDPGEPHEEGDVDLTPPAEPISKLGEVYELGRHRLMCGDSTDTEAIARLFGTRSPSVIWSDPPYGKGGYAGRGGKLKPVKGDNQPDDVIRSYFALGNAPEVYVCCDWESYHHLLAARGKPRSCIVWAKNVFGMGNGYRRQHEFIGYYGTFDSTTESDLWEIAKVSTKYEHPTEKPPALARRAIENSSKSGDVVFCPFGGSGDALVASEQVGRTCFIVELEPGYCDVIRRRYEAYVSQQPVSVK